MLGVQAPAPPPPTEPATQPQSAVLQGALQMETVLQGSEFAVSMQ